MALSDFTEIWRPENNRIIFDYLEFISSSNVYEVQGLVNRNKKYTLSFCGRKFKRLKIHYITYIISGNLWMYRTLLINNNYKILIP